MKTLNLLLFFLIATNFFLLGYLLSPTSYAVYEKEKATLTRAIDGDTIETDLGKVRLLGINTPEKKQPFHDEALEFLKQYEGKQIELERTLEDKDKYGRSLRYGFYQNTFINEEILKEGLANFYSYNEDKYTSKLKKAEGYARDNERGIWKKSSNAGCIEFEKLQYQEQERCNNQELLILKNNCETLNLILKDDANHIYNIEINSGLYYQNFSCVWNDEGDSLYLRDEEGLVLFYRY